MQDPRVNPWPLVGREQQLKRIAGALEERRGVVVHGPPGVGKTTLVRTAMQRAAANGAAIEWVAATQSSASMPFGAYAPLLPPATHGFADRARLLSATIRTVTERARSRPLIVAVDDAHLLDPGSATLTFLLQSTAAASVVVTVRSEVPCPDAVVALWEKQYAVRVDLEPLDRAQVRDVLVAALGGPVERRTVDWFADRSAGNPMVVRELLDSAISSGVLGHRIELWQLLADPPLSSRLVDLVLAKLVGVDPTVREVIELLALGEPLEADVLTGLTSSEAVLAAERSGLVALHGEEIRLVHPLHGELVASMLGPIQTRALLARLADALKSGPDPAGTNRIRVAVWMLATGQHPAPELLLAAAQEANRRFDADLAVPLASAAQAAGAGAPAALVLATAFSRSNRFAAAEDTLAPLESEIAGHPDALDYLRLRVATLHEGLGRTEDASAVLNRASRWGSASWPSRVEALRVPLLLDDGRLRQAASLGRQLISDAGDSAEVIAVVGAPTSLALLLTGATRDAEELANRLLPPGDGLLPAELGWLPVQAWVAARLRSGRNWHELEPRIAVLHTEAIADRDEVLAGLAELTLGRIALSMGRLDQALSWVREATVHLEASDPRRALVASLSLLATIHAMEGKPEAAAAAQARVQVMLANQRSRWWALIELALSEVWVAAAQGEMSRARQIALQHAAAAGEAVLDRALFLHLAMRVGVPADQVAAPLSDIAAATDADLVHAYAAHAAALAAGEAQGLEIISTRFEQIGAVLHAAQAAAEAAQAFRRDGRDASSRRAANRSSQLAKRCPGAIVPALSQLSVAPLTPREAEVAGLAARGLSNAVIADRLVLSVRSVESHLYRAMHKLGVETRRDLPLDG